MWRLAAAVGMVESYPVQDCRKASRKDNQRYIVETDTQLGDVYLDAQLFQHLVELGCPL
jgi:hypothetical protein